MALEQQIAALTAQANALTTEVTGKMAAIDAKVAQAKIDFANLTPEKRITQQITIGGSADYLYPVWWLLSNSSFASAKISIGRSWYYNGPDPVGGLIGLKNHTHVYDLFLEMEGSGFAYAGGANFLQIKRFHERYDVGVSHVAFAMHSDALLSTTTACPVLSGCYLRGGGLTYDIVTNAALGLLFQDGSLGINAVNEIYNDGTSHWSVKPIALGIKDPVTGLYPNIQTPVADLLPY